MNEYAAIPDETGVIDAPKANMSMAELETPRVLFFAMDTISDREKRQLDFKEFGGIHLPHIKTLGNKGMLYRCQLTRLPKYRNVPEWVNMLGPNSSIQTETSFVQTFVQDGVAKEKEINGFMMSDPSADRENGEFKLKRSNHIVYRKRYAAQDAAAATRRPTMGNAPGGVVEITALKGASPAEVNEAQLFFFESWDDIKRGKSFLPKTVDATERLIKSRVEKIALQDWDEAKKQKFYKIGQEMVTSCNEYARRAKEAIRSDETIVKDGAIHGASGTIHHSDISEQYLEQTGTRRKEDLLTGEASSVAELSRLMLAKEQAETERAEKALLLEERKQYTAEIAAGLRERDEQEEIRLGIRKATAPPAEIIDHPTQDDDINPRYKDMTAEQIVDDIENQVLTEIFNKGDGQSLGIITDTRLCGQPTANGSCARVLKLNEERCWQHPE